MVINMHKSAIAVYNPDDPLEKAIQVAAKKYTGEWLPSYPCQLMAKSIYFLKFFDDWEVDDLIDTRVDYFFSPHMTSHLERTVFLTYPLFLRDMLENNEINSSLHDPIVFVSQPLAHYLFRNMPVHLHVDTGILKAQNHKVKLFTLGGLIISENNNISISNESVRDIVAIDSDSQGGIRNVEVDCGWSNRKLAAVQKEPGVFHIGEHEKDLLADQKVYNKHRRNYGKINMVEQGETGSVHIEDDNGELVILPKNDFDLVYSLV
jgi:hypothetical protein